MLLGLLRIIQSLFFLELKCKNIPIVKKVVIFIQLLKKFPLGKKGKKCKKIQVDETYIIKFLLLISIDFLFFKFFIIVFKI